MALAKWRAARGDSDRAALAVASQPGPNAGSRVTWGEDSDSEECKVRGDPRAQGNVVEGSPRRPRGRSGCAPGEGGGDRDSQSTRRRPGTCGPTWKGGPGEGTAARGTRTRAGAAGPRGMREPKEMKLGGEGSQEWEGQGRRQPNLRRAWLERAEGTLRRPLSVQRGTRAGGAHWEILPVGKEERGERGLEQGKEKMLKDLEKVKAIGLELRAKMMVAKGGKAQQKIGSIQNTTAWSKSCQKRAHKLLLK